VLRRGGELAVVLLATVTIICFGWLLIQPAQAATTPTPLPLFGANVHPWADWQNDVGYVAQTPGMSIVRWDEQVPGAPVADVVARYDYVKSKGLTADIVLVQPCCDYNVTFTYVRSLALAMGTARKPIVEIGNEPDYNGWPAATYMQALYAANNAMQQSGMRNLKITMAGLANNDQPYLRAMGLIGNASWMTAYADAHFYTQGGNPPYGPLTPDDLDLDHEGLLSFVGGIKQYRSEFPDKELIVGEFGWANTVPEATRSTYLRAAVSIARAQRLKALIVEEIGSGDGPASDMRGTAAWQAFSDAASAP
jgi:hypothetical protein